MSNFKEDIKNATKQTATTEAPPKPADTKEKGKNTKPASGISKAQQRDEELITEYAGALQEETQLALVQARDEGRQLGLMANGVRHLSKTQVDLKATKARIEKQRVMGEARMDLIQRQLNDDVIDAFLSENDDELDLMLGGGKSHLLLQGN
jgi:hypothetical protein